MNKKMTIAMVVAMLSTIVPARTISTGSAECRAGTTVTIPVTIDDVCGAALVAITVNSDSTVMTGIGVTAGELADSASMMVVNGAEGRMSVVIPRLAATSGGGELCRLKYRVREGTTDLYSDVALANVQVCAADGVTDLSATNPIEISNGMVRVTADGEDGDAEIEIVVDDGDLSEDAEVAVRDALAEIVEGHPEIASVKVKGEVGLIPITASLGIAPHVDILGAEATATYTRPSITITEFDPATGMVRIRVDPGEGNAIRAPLVKGCIHVYGTSNLGEKMRYIGNTEIDLTPYLQTDTMGEARLTVDLGTHTFLKVKAETVIRKEGEVE